jgi:hypothetical protein
MKERVSEVRLFWDPDGQEEKMKRGKRKCKIFGACLGCGLLVGFCFSTTSTSFKTPIKPLCKNFLSLLS